MIYDVQQRLVQQKPGGIEEHQEKCEIFQDKFLFVCLQHFRINIMRIGILKMWRYERKYAKVS